MKSNSGFEARRFFLAIAFLAGLGFVTHASAQQYLVDLNTGTTTRLGLEASALNDAGQVVGTAQTADGYSHAFITGPDGVGMTDLGTLGGNSSRAYGINDAGQVVGESSTTNGSRHAFITGSDGVGMRDLGTLGGNRSAAYSINDAGQVVGEASVPSDYLHAFITGPDGVGMRDLGTLGGNYSAAYSINDTGQVVGTSYTADIESPGFITGPGGAGMRPLAESGWFSITPRGINDIGQVVGNGIFPEGGAHVSAFITGPDGVGMREVGAFREGNFFILSEAYGINDAGRVVGTSTTADGSFHAFITGSDGGGVTDLNSLVESPTGLVFTHAFAINNSDQVLAVGVIGVIPEPQVYALLLSGLVLIGFMAQRKRIQNLAEHH